MPKALDVPDLDPPETPSEKAGDWLVHHEEAPTELPPISYELDISPNTEPLGAKKSPEKPEYNPPDESNKSPKNPSSERMVPLSQVLAENKGQYKVALDDAIPATGRSVTSRNWHRSFSGLSVYQQAILWGIVAGGIVLILLFMTVIR